MAARRANYMGYRDSILTPRGYRVTYADRTKSRGLGKKWVCLAEKNGRSFYAFHAKEHYPRIWSVQNSVPHMALIEEITAKVAVFEAAPGRLLWDTDRLSTVERIEQQLVEFAEGTTSNGLIHGDLRPWNVVVDGTGNLLVIDWDHSCFADDLHVGHELVARGGHLAEYHPKRKWDGFSGIDIVDAKLIGRLMRGEVTYTQAWPGGRPGDFPRWCRP